VLTPSTPLFCCPTLRPPISRKDPAEISHFEQCAQKLGTGAPATGLEVGKEVRMHIDRRHRGNPKDPMSLSIPTLLSGHRDIRNRRPA